MECDAAGANIYHIIVRRNTFHSYFFLSFTFNFLFVLGWARAVAIKIDQLQVETKFALVIYRVCG